MNKILNQFQDIHRILRKAKKKKKKFLNSTIVNSRNVFQ